MVVLRGLCDSQMDCGVFQVYGFAFSDVGGGGPGICQPERFAGVH